MGIQSGLNQLFAASIGAGFAITQSTGVKQIAENRIARKAADKEVAAATLKRDATTADATRLLNTIESLEKKNEVFGPNEKRTAYLNDLKSRITDYGVSKVEADVGLAEAQLKRAEVYEKQGKLTKEAKAEYSKYMDPDRVSEQEEELSAKNSVSAKRKLDFQIKELEKAYAAKQAVQNSAKARRQLIEETRKEREAIRKEILKK